MANYDPQKHHRHSIRLKGYDYTRSGAYFITLVTWRRECMFGEVVNGVVRLNPIGIIIDKEWRQMGCRFPNIHFDAFVVMPNHIHGIIIIHRVGATRPAPDMNLHGKDPVPDLARDGKDGSPLQDGKDPFPGKTRDCNDGSPRHANGPAAGSLGAMVGQFKSRATKRIWAIPGMEQTPIWQRNYYDHIIRNEQDFERIWNYIATNPQRWHEDQLHPSAPPNRFNQE